jgi:hypothetical protein
MRSLLWVPVLLMLGSNDPSQKQGWHPDKGYFVQDFTKNVSYDQPHGCLHREVGIHYNGQLLVCNIEAPPEAVGYIDRYEFTCDGEADPEKMSDPCKHVYLCPDKGWCKWKANGAVIQYNVEPHNLNLVDTRELKWYAWTNDGGGQTLGFVVYMRPDKRNP